MNGTQFRTWLDMVRVIFSHYALYEGITITFDKHSNMKNYWGGLDGNILVYKVIWWRLEGHAFNMDVPHLFN